MAVVIQEAYIQGVSTRSVDEMVKGMGMSGTSESQVSRLAGEVDERVHTFLDRPLEGDWPYLWIDATYIKVMEAGRIVSVAVIIAVAVNTNGGREVLAHIAFPKAHRRQLHSTNPLERLNEQIKRRTEVVGIFPNGPAITRLVGAMLLEQNDGWCLQWRCMQLEAFEAVSDNPQAKLSAVIN
jgi:transposase-like protein